MASPTLLQNDFHLGMKRDFPRDDLPRGAVWGLVDLLPELGAALGLRGSWEYASPDLSTVTANTLDCERAVDVPFSGGRQLIAIARLTGNSRRLFKITSDAAATDMGLFHASSGPADHVFYRDKLYITNANANLVSYDGAGAPASIGGVPGVYYYVASYKDRLLMAHSAGEPQRVVFSAAGDATTWPAASFIDMPDQVFALAVLRDSILVFGEKVTHRIRGSIPPPNSDMSVDHAVFPVGIEHSSTVATSVSYYRDAALWSDKAGVYMSDGAALENLVETGGMSSYWEALMAGSGSGPHIGEVFREYYLITVLNASSLNFVDCLVCHLPTRRWFRISNLKARQMAAGAGAMPQIYAAGGGGVPRVLRLSPIFKAPTTVGDANGSGPTPVLETPFYLPGGEGKKTWKFLYLAHDIRRAGGAVVVNPSYVTSPEPAAAYTALTPTFAETAARRRARVPLRFANEGLGFKLAPDVMPDDWRIYSVGADIHAREPSRV